MASGEAHRMVLFVITLNPIGGRMFVCAVGSSMIRSDAQVELT